MNELFIVRLTPNQEKIQANMAEKQSLVKGHNDYLDKLANDKVILFGGPMEGKPGGLLVVTAISTEQVEELFNQDPLIKNSYLNAEINKWTIKHGNSPISI